MDKIKILVVDDESRMRKLVRDFLVRQDYEVLEKKRSFIVKNMDIGFTII